MAKIKDRIRAKVLSWLGLQKYNATPGYDRETFINDDDYAQKTKLREYLVWYDGDSDELQNFYTRQNTIEYNFEPWYSRNKKAYFWCIASTEEDVKKTHSGQPRNIIDTLVNVCGVPNVSTGKIGDDEGIPNLPLMNLEAILEENNFWTEIYQQTQMPFTMVEGWGCYKINWNSDISNYPLIYYYTAENVEYIKAGNKIIGIVFKDYYITKEGKRYLVLETRRIEKNNLIIEKEAFELYSEDEEVRKVELNSIPELQDVEPVITVEGYNKFLAVPCKFFRDVNPNLEGRSIFKGKIDLFDDLDQCLSQSANTVRRSTPLEYFNTDFLERDRKTGLPIQPKVYDRKYSSFTGGKRDDGANNVSMPVVTTQPQLDFARYSSEAIAILMEIIDGIMSPATLGIDLSKKDNADAQREKEKVTIFTRNTIIRQEEKILKELFVQLLCAYELMTTGEITTFNYDLSIRFSEFADTSFENKLECLGDAYTNGLMTPEMFLEKLYNKTLTKKEYDRELEYLKENQEAKQGAEGMGGTGMNPMFGGEDFGEDEQEF